MTINFVLGGLFFIFQKISPKQKTMVFYLLAILFNGQIFFYNLQTGHLSGDSTFTKVNDRRIVFEITASPENFSKPNQGFWDN